MIKDELLIYDTTLRDGEQMPGVVFSLDQKRELIDKSLNFGVDIIDLMPFVSESEMRLAENLMNDGYQKKIISATPLKKDFIDKAKKIGFEKLIMFTSVSDIHLQKKLNLSREENLEKTLRLIDYARNIDLNIAFAGEDSTRADISYLIDFINSLNGKIDYFLPCDTLGILTPNETYEFIKMLKNETDVKIGLHCHNDFGQATANTLAGIVAGADIFSGTFTGIGERCGNASIEEVVMSLLIQYDKKLNLNYNMLTSICNKVEEYSGIKMQRHKAVCGENAFSHESGLHVDGILKDPLNYEIYNPEIIGRKRKILFGKHSGISSLKYLFGDKFSNEEYSNMLKQVKEFAESQKRTLFESEVRRMFVNGGIVK